MAMVRGAIPPPLPPAAASVTFRFDCIASQYLCSNRRLFHTTATTTTSEASSRWQHPRRKRPMPSTSKSVDQISLSHRFWGFVRHYHNDDRLFECSIEDNITSSNDRPMMPYSARTTTSQTLSYHLWNGRRYRWITTSSKGTTKSPSSSSSSVVAEEKWNNFFQRLLQYKIRNNGSTLVPQNYSDDPPLGRWVKNQRQRYTRKNLKSDQIKMLESIGFWWDGREGLWQEKFNALVEYKNRHGSTLIPKRYEPDPTLAHWVVTQRQFYKQNILSRDRIEQLESIDFVWDPLEQSWDEMFQQWIEWREKGGNDNDNDDDDSRSHNDEETKQAATNDTDDDTSITDIDIDTITSTNDQGTPSSKSSKLKDWIDFQRVVHSMNRLSESRRRRLLDAGFEFEPWEASWWDNYGQLVEYHKKHGHANIPYIYDEHPSLGRWVHTQRSVYKKKRLASDRIDALNKLDFVWEIRNVATEAAATDTSTDSDQQR